MTETQAQYTLGGGESLTATVPAPVPANAFPAGTPFSYLRYLDPQTVEDMTALARRGLLRLRPERGYSLREIDIFALEMHRIPVPGVRDLIRFGYCRVGALSAATEGEA